MPNSRISALTDGAPAVLTDVTVIERGAAANFRLTWANVFTLFQAQPFDFSSSWYTFVGGQATATANGTALVAAYAAAKLKTPGGNALSASNRHTIVLLPGVYSVTDGALVLDTAFIDLIGLSANSGQGFFASGFTDHGDTIITSTGHTVGQTAGDVTLANICLRTSSATKYAWNLSTAATTQNKLINVLLVNTNSIATASMAPAITLAGYYQDVRAWNVSSFGNDNTSVCSGTFIRCKAGSFSFATALSAGSVASGVFWDCEADGASFGTNGTASGKFYRCKYVAVDTTASPMFGGAGTASGYFQDCDGNGIDGCFGDTASGQFLRCRANITTTISLTTGGAFGCGTTGLASGNFWQCDAGHNSFGGSNNTTGRTFNGKAYMCKAGNNSFGGGSATAGTMSGIMYSCVTNGRLNAVVTGIIEDTDITVAAVDHTAVLVATGARIKRCMLVGNGTGFSVDAPSAASVQIYLCACNLGFGANVTNIITTPYNVNDTGIS